MFQATELFAQGLQVSGMGGTYTTTTDLENVLGYAFAANDIVTVTGAHSFTSPLTLNIPAGKTLVWQADYSSTTGVSVTGSGTLEIRDGGKLKVVTNGIAFIIRQSATVIVRQDGLMENRQTTANAANTIRLEGNATLIVDGGTVGGYAPASSNSCAIAAVENSSVFIRSGMVENGFSGLGDIRTAVRMSGNSALSITGGTVRNTAAVNESVNVSGTAVVYVSGGTIAPGSIRNMGGGTVGAYYTGSNAALFSAVEFTAAANNLFNLNAAPALTADGSAYTYNAATPYEGNVVATFPAGLAITGVAATPLTATNTFGGNTATFSGAFDHNSITLAVTGTLAGSRIQVSFTTASFGVNVSPSLKTNVSANISFIPGNVGYDRQERDCAAATISGITAGANPGWTYTYTALTGALGTNNKPYRAGTYSVVAIYEDDDNKGTATGTFTITQRALTVSATVNDKVYDNTGNATFDGTPALVGVVSGDVVSLTNGTPTFSITGVNSNNPIPINFTTPFSLGGADAGNYTLTQPAGITARITPKPLTISGATIDAKNFDGSTTATFNDTGSGITFSEAPPIPTLVAGITATGIFDTPNAGSGKTVNIAVTLTDNNYSLAVNTFSLTGQTIDKATFTVPDVSRFVIFDNTTPQTVDIFALVADRALAADVLSYTIGTVTDGDAILASNSVTTDGISFALTGSPTLSSPAQTATIPVTVGGFTNYHDVTVNVVVTLTDRTSVTVAIAPAGKTYDGSAVVAVASASGIPSGDFSYTWLDAAGTPLAPNVAPSDAGDYRVKAEVSGASAAAFIGEETIDFTIAKRPVTVKADNLTVTQGAALPAPTVSYTGFVGGDNATTALSTQAVAQLNVANTNTAGVSVIDFATQAVPNATVGANYTLVHDNGTLTVAAAAVVLGAPTAVSAVAGNGQATVTFTAPASNGGSPITAYTVTASPGGLTATGASSPITINGLTNGTAYTFTVTATNAIGVGTASAASNAVTPAAPTTPTAYTVTVIDGTGSGNYAAGATVAVNAGTPPVGQQFAGWTAAPASLVAFASAASERTTFTMPAANVTVTANYEPVPLSQKWQLALPLIEAATFALPQEKAGDTDVIRYPLAASINQLIAGTDFVISHNDIVVFTANFRPATAGDAGKPAGENGYYAFRVSPPNLSSAYAEGTITATPYDATSNEAITQGTLKAWTQNGTLYVSGLTAGKPWSVYNLSGVLVYRTVADSGEAHIPLSGRGIYIIINDESQIKIIH